MTTTPGNRTVDALVQRYLERLHAAAATLPADRRADLVEGISEHIAAARAAGAAADEAAVRTLLDRLGQPEEIVAAARDEGEPAVAAWPASGTAGYGPPAYAGVVTRPPSTALEAWAVAMLTVGSLVPVVGWVVGVVLLWVSKRWTIGEKLLGTLVVPFGPGVVLLAGFVLPAGETCVTSSGGVMIDAGTGLPLGDPTSTTTCSGGLPLPLLIASLVVALVGPVLVAVLLYRRARARAALEPPVPVAASGARTWGGLEITAVVLLSAGSFVLPVVGPLVGLVLVLVSDRWTGGQKAVGTVIAISPFLLLVLFGGLAALTTIGS